MKERIYSIDGFRIIAAFLVVSLHVSLPFSIPVMTPVARIAVPFFYMVSGYFYSPSKTRSSIILLLKYLVVAMVAYFFIEWFLYRDLSFVSEELAKFDHRFWVFNVIPFCPVGWYIASYIYMLIFCIFVKNQKVLYMIGVLSLILALITGPYNFLTNIEFDPSIWNCNAFCTICWFILGRYLKEHRINFFASLSNNTILIVSIVLIIMQAVEHFLIKKVNGSCSGTIYLTTPFAMIALFEYLLCNKNALKILNLGKCALWVFLSHVGIHYLLVSIFYPEKFQLGYEPLIELSINNQYYINNITCFILSLIIYMTCKKM